jgi:hypothetical protein
MDANKLMELMKAKKQSLKQKEKTIKPQPGGNRYVVLPGWRKGEEYVWYHDFGQHFVKNSAGDIQMVYPCNDKTYGTSCSICEGLSAAARMTTDDDILKVLGDAKAAQTYLLNVLALDSDDDTTPQVLEIKKSAFSQIVDIIEEWGMTVFDDETPQIITINRDGKALNTKYTVQISPKKHTLPKGVMSKLRNLDEFVSQENEENQRKALTAINNVAGLLPKPPSADTPRTSSSAVRGYGEATTTSAKASPELSDELDDLLSDLTGTDD